MGLLGLAVPLLLAGMLAAPGPSVAEEGAAAQERFKATSHRRFDKVEHWTKVFDDPSRAQWQRPELVVETLDIHRGSTVADLGAGTGYFSRLLAEAVGPNGTVLAVENEPNLVAHLRERAELEETANVTPILASADNPRLPRGLVERVLLVDTFHHIDDRLKYFRRLQQGLAKGFRVAIVDWKKKELPVGPELDHKLARIQVIDEMTEAGYRLAGESRALPYQYFLIFSATER